MVKKFNPFLIATALIVIVGLACHFWGAWYAPVIAIIMIAVIPDNNYFIRKLMQVGVWVVAVWGLYQFPFGGAEVQATLGSAAAAYLTTFFFGNIIANYFNQEGAFAA